MKYETILWDKHQTESYVTVTTASSDSGTAPDPSFCPEG